MAVIAKISVGDIFFYEVDSKPVHSAPKGSVAILNSDGLISMYKNNDGSTTWLKTIKPAYGELYLNGNTNILNWDDYTVGAFYSYDAAASWTLGDSTNGFAKRTDATFGDTIQYTGSSDIRVVYKVRTTTRGGPAKWQEFEHGVAKNFTIGPSETNGFHTLDNAGTNGVGIISTNLLQTNDDISVAFSPVRKEAGGPAAQRAFINRHCQLGVFKIDEGIQSTLFTEDWESSGFTENSWTVVNDSENIWVVGQADNNGGTSSAYVSNDGGTSQTYNINNAEASHFYKDFAIPDGTVTLTFDWKCQGENAAAATQYDYGALVIADTTTTPVAGAEVSTTQATGGGNGRLGADTNLGKFNLNYGTTPGTTWNTETIDLSDYAGQTKRLIFTWKNDGSVGANPPFTVDNILIKSLDW